MDSNSSTNPESSPSPPPSDQSRSPLPLLIVGAIGIVVGYVVADAVNKYEQQAAIEINWSYAPAKQKRLLNQTETAKARETTPPATSEKNAR